MISGRVKTVVVCDVNQHDEAWRSLPDFIRWLFMQLKKVPREYRGLTSINIKSSSEGFVTIEISYTRPYTQAEDEAEERGGEFLRVWSNKGTTLIKERDLYEQLKAKFEPEKAK